MSDYRIIREDELYHYGVPGMRWGHRKREAKTEYRRRLGASLDKYDKTIERIEKSYKRGQTLSKKDQERERKALNTQVREADKAKADYKKAKADIKAEKKEYKQAKTERKQNIKSTYKELNKNASRKEKKVYSDATRKLAAKYIVDNNMSISDAKTKANKVAKRNTAIILGAYGAYTVAQLYNINKQLR